jgi:hypothetical protein
MHIINITINLFKICLVGFESQWFYILKDSETIKEII